MSFNFEKAYTRATSTGIVVITHKLTFNKLRKSLHCSICLAYNNNSKLQKVSRDSKNMRKKATDFCAILDELLINTEIETEKKLPVKRRIQDPLGNNVIIDCVLDNTKKRITNHKELHKDFSCLDPRHFSEFKDCGLPSGS